MDLWWEMDDSGRSTVLYRAGAASGRAGGIMSRLIELLERVEEAGGPDREIDAAIWLALTPGVSRRKTGYTHIASGKWCEIDETRDATGRLIIVPSYTASVDATLALVERKLPGWRLRLQIEGDDTHEAWLENKGDFGAICARDTQSFCASPALAIVGSLLRALIAKAAP